MTWLGILILFALLLGTPKISDTTARLYLKWVLWYIADYMFFTCWAEHIDDGANVELVRSILSERSSIPTLVARSVSQVSPYKNTKSKFEPYIKCAGYLHLNEPLSKCYINAPNRE